MSRNGQNNKGGRPKGKKSKSTLEKEAVLAILRQRIMRNADILFDAQLSIARGIMFLYKIEKKVIGSGKNKKIIPQKPKLVESQWEIEQYLEKQIDEGDIDDPEDTYYYITTKEPNNQSIDSMFDRALGKAPQSMQLSDPDGKPIPITAINVIPIENK